MGPRRCSGFVQECGSVVECRFNPEEPGKRAQGKHEGKCMWCSHARLQEVCKDVRLRKLAARALASLFDQDKAVFDAAVARASTHEDGDDLIRRANVILTDRNDSGESAPAGEAAPPALAS